MSTKSPLEVRSTTSAELVRAEKYNHALIALLIEKGPAIILAVVFAVSGIISLPTAFFRLF